MQRPDQHLLTVSVVKQRWYIRDMDTVWEYHCIVDYFDFSSL
jgi:hypothetical protein